MLAYGNWLRSTYFREFEYLKLRKVVDLEPGAGQTLLNPNLMFVSNFFFIYWLKTFFLNFLTFLINYCWILSVLI